MLCAICIAFFIVGLYRLDTLPGEWFGDISIVNNYVSEILAGNHPFIFVTSAGPVYFYCIAPIIYLVGASFLTYKLISLSVGVVGIVVIYLFARALFSSRIALITSFLTACSFWYLVWARLGNYNICVPILTACMLYCFLKYVHGHHFRWLAGSIIASGFGLFLYAGTFVLPVVLCALYLYDLVWQRKKMEWRQIWRMACWYLPIFTLFMLLLFLSARQEADGYLGTKLIDTFSLPLGDFLLQLGRNAFRTLTMLHLEGDIVFRWNIPAKPLIDTVSGIVFIFGVLLLFIQKKSCLPYIVIPACLLLIPSILPGHPAIEVPSSPRTLAILPFVFVSIAYGIDCMYVFFKEKIGPFGGKILLLALCVVILYLNMYAYFVQYPTHLPNRNVPYSKLIAAFIDTVSTETPVYITALEWGEWGQPEYDGIYYALQHRDRILSTDVPTCDLVGTAFVVIASPYQQEEVSVLQSCIPTATIREHRKNGQLVFLSLTN